MFSKFVKKKVQDIDQTHNRTFEAHFLVDHTVPNFFPSEQGCAGSRTLNLAQNPKNRPKFPKYTFVDIESL